MQVSWTRALTALALYTAVVYAFGRFSAPERVEIKKEVVTVEVEKKSTQKDQQVDQQKKTTEVEITKPDGTKIKKKVTELDKKTDTQIDQHVETQKDQTLKESKVVENSRVLHLSVLAGLNLTDLKAPLVFGAHATRPFLGPISVGLYGLSTGVGGVSLGLQF